MLTLTLLSQLACTGDKTTVTPDDTGADDTSADTADTADTSDTQDTADTGWDGPVLTWVLDTEVTGAAIALHPIDLATGFEEVGPAWQSAAVSGTRANLPATEPPAEWASPIEGFPDTTLALFAPVLWDDPNGNAVHDEGEVFRASTATMVAYVDGTLPPALASIGIVLGWNALTFSMRGDVPTPVPTGAMPLPLNLDPAMEITFGGTTGGEPEGWTLLVLPATLLSGGVGAPLYAAPLTSPWSVTLTGEPPANHMQDFDDAGTFRGAYEMPIAWADTDGVEGLSDGDRLQSACVIEADGPALAQILWVEPITDPLFAVQFGFMGSNAGWMGISASGEGVRMDDATLTSLLFADGCSAP